MKQRGFSLVELMISLVLGLVISGAIIQTLVGTRVTNSLNEAMSQVQESGRFITRRLTGEFLQAGRYDVVTARVANGADSVVEAAYVENRPIVLSGDYPSHTEVRATEGASGANDTIAINMLGDVDCAGNRHDYPVGEEFHVVNLFRVVDGRLTCSGYDGRVLRAIRGADVTPGTVVLMDNVASFQVQYGVTQREENASGQAVRYVPATQLHAVRAQNRQVVALRFAILLYSDSGKVNQAQGQQFALLGEAPVRYDKGHYYQVFTQTVALRNVKNFVRSSQ